MRRLHRIPKLGSNGTTETTVYLQSGGIRYKVEYEAFPSQTFGSTSFSAQIDVYVCTNASSNDSQENCESLDNPSDPDGADPIDDFSVSNREVTYELIDEFLTWDVGANRSALQEGYFPQAPGDTTAGGTCNGWDSNTDTGNDDYNGYNIRWPTDLDPFGPAYCGSLPTPLADNCRGTGFQQGDVIPADWMNDKRNVINARLSPNGTTFDQAPFFENFRDGGDSFLDLLNTANRPLIAFGSTPLGASMNNFYSWYRTAGGWRATASLRDPDWGCRKKYLIILTDGDDTCTGGLTAACNTATNLRLQEAMRSYVVAFGIPGGGNALKCIAENGGQPDCTACETGCVAEGEPGYATCELPGCVRCTPGCLKPADPGFVECGDGDGDPLYPQNKAELVRALTDILESIREESRAFASAAVPSVEANVKDKIYLSDFTPLGGEAFWDGHLDAYLKPLPIDSETGLPADEPGDTDYRSCASFPSACHLWDVGQRLLLQSPTPDDISSGTRMLGTGLQERRLLYPDSSGALVLLDEPIRRNDDTVWIDFLRGLGFQDAALSPVPQANKDRATAIIDRLLVQKTSVVTEPCPPPNQDDDCTRNVTFVLGDAFHSDPLVIENPRDFEDFASDKFGTGGTCDGTASTDAGYRCFAFLHQYRRKVLLVGANDGQLHAFDAGRISRDTLPLPLPYNVGDGVEMFSVLPRLGLPIVRDQAEGNRHIYGVDGPIVSGDAFFQSDEQWHTMVVASMRDGGLILGGAMVHQPENGAAGSTTLRNGYFALDVTQPDPLEERTFGFVPRSQYLDTDSSTAGDPDPGAVPGCLDPDGGTRPSCPRPYPLMLWEFNDTAETGLPFDEDLNNLPDFGVSWSKPVLTRVRLDTGAVDAGGNPVLEERFVVVIGGGFDAAKIRDANPDVGNFVYILDAETGSVLYKREVLGGVPAVAVLDSDGDNVANTIYFGTTAGRLYKMDVSTAPELTTVTVRDTAGTAVSVERVNAPDWEPFVTFRTGNDEPVFLQIQVLFLQRLARYALVFGTGLRPDLWDPDAGQGRFYVLVDDGWTAIDPNTSLPFVPRTEASYTQVTPDGITLGTGVNLLLDPFPGLRPGWYMLLDEDERVITKAFGLSGILIISSFQPEVVPEGTALDRVCSRTGRSRNFVVFTFNGDPVSDLDLSGAKDRALEISDFVSAPVVDQTQTQNVSGSSGDDGADDDDDSSPSNPRIAEIIDVLKQQGPSNARYGNYYLRLGQRMSQRGMFYPACIPIAILERNWREN
jgi:hypothetical protein